MESLLEQDFLMRRNEKMWQRENEKMKVEQFERKKLGHGANRLPQNGNE